MLTVEENRHRDRDTVLGLVPYIDVGTAIARCVAGTADGFKLRTWSRVTQRFPFRLILVVLRSAARHPSYC